MISRLTLTALMLIFVTAASAQSSSQELNTPFKGKTPSAKERGLKALENEEFFRTFAKEIPNKTSAEAKSATSFAARLDSAVSEEGMKVILSYDDNGNCTSEIVSFWEFPGIWLTYHQVETSYNSDNLPVEVIDWWLNEMSQTLEPIYRETTTFLESGMIDEIISYAWDFDAWVTMAKASYVYDDEDRVSETVYSLWDENANVFDLVSNEVYSYNASGGLTERLRSYWTGSQWVNSLKETLTLNEQNQPTSAVFSTWQTVAEIWMPMTSAEYTYNSAGLEAEAVFSNWVQSEEAFVPEAKSARIYNSADKLLSEEFLIWEESESVWIGLYLDTFEYDEVGNVTTSTYQYWDEDASEYVTEGMEVATFNNDYPSETIMAPLEFRDYTDHMVLTSTYFYDDMGELVEEETVEFFYTIFDVVPVKDDGRDAFSVYPNPFRETIRFSGTVELQRFTLFDLQGRMVMQKQMAGAAEVNPGHLPAGMYVYRIEGAGVQQTGKLIKE